MNETQYYTSPSMALRYVRKELFGMEISYREVALYVSKFCDVEINKAEIWNAEHRKYRCPRHICDALVNMALMKRKRRWRFFYEVDEEKYEKIAAWLEKEGMTFQQALEESNLPWV